MFKDSVVLITGGTGSWGQELTRQLLTNHKIKEIRIYSRGEHKQVEMKRKFQDKRIKYFIGDIRDRERVNVAVYGVDYIFHLAALKHVPVCEENPWEAVQTNIIGIQNIIESAIEHRVKKVIDVSTDKAVDPFNLYGVSKACGEKMTIAGNRVDHTQFLCVRGGNVLGTNGSVIPLFREQILKLNEVTITDDRMTRFLMRLEEAIGLLLFASINSHGGEVFVMKMPACRISDLAEVMILELGNNKTRIRKIGIRPGEKLYEVLVSKYEMPRTFEIDNYFVILPQIKLEGTEKFYKDKQNFSCQFEEFSSNNTHILSKKEIKNLLVKDGWLKSDINNEATSYLRSLKKEDLEKFFESEGWTKNNKR
ncbi:MAG TPA: polysaccharide biosynthesis protein [Patescibacteria group bacterium]|nr:polysaccharide biosynthesis protein [Patescibacteria group bacterium]